MSQHLISISFKRNIIIPTLEQPYCGALIFYLWIKIDLTMLEYFGKIVQFLFSFYFNKSAKTSHGQSWFSYILEKLVGFKWFSRFISQPLCSWCWSEHEAWSKCALHIVIDSIGIGSVEESIDAGRNKFVSVCPKRQNNSNNFRVG